MSSYNSADTARFRFRAADKQLPVVSFTLEEGISTLFDLRLTLAGDRFDSRTLIGRPALLVIDADDSQRRVHGMITGLAAAGKKGETNLYAAGVAPLALKLTKRSGGRVFPAPDHRADRAHGPWRQRHHRRAVRVQAAKPVRPAPLLRAGPPQRFGVHHQLAVPGRHLLLFRASSGQAHHGVRGQPGRLPPHGRRRTDRLEPRRRDESRRTDRFRPRLPVRHRHGPLHPHGLCL